MNNLNVQFFEQYKIVEKICSEMYGIHNGLSQYINEMEAVSYYHRNQVSGFDSDLARLKRLRYLRNQLAHNNGSFEESLCTLDDVNWLKNFYHRILETDDPIARLSAIQRNSQRSNMSNERNGELLNNTEYNNTQNINNTNNFINILVYASIFIVLICLLSSFFLVMFLIRIF